MTHRSLSQRIAAWLMVALLALVVGEPLRAHECPVHARSAALATVAHADGGGGDHGDGHHAGSDASGHRVAADHADDGPADDAGDHGCDCLGTCCTVAPVAAPQVVAVRTSVSRVVAPAIAARAPLAAVPAGEHVLPFAIGPPARA